MASALTEAPPRLQLGPAVTSVGFSLGDHQQVIAELGALPAPGMPARAVAKRQAEFLAGRFAAQRALATLGVLETPGRNADGTPRWPGDIVGSISHGARRAICAVARASELRSLGIDVEQLMEASASDALRARICAADERASLARALPVPDHHLVTYAFSAKESLYKCLYPLIGQFMDFAAARVTAASARADEGGLAGQLTLELSMDWSTEFRRGRSFEAVFWASGERVESAVLLSR